MVALDAPMQEWLDLANEFNRTSRKKNALIIDNKFKVLFDSFNNIDLSKPDSLPSEASHLLEVLELLDEKVRPTNVKPNLWQHRYRDVFAKINKLMDKKYNSELAFAACLSILPHIFRGDGLQNTDWKLNDSFVGDTLLPAFFVAFEDLSFRFWQDRNSQNVSEDYNSIMTVYKSLTSDKDHMIERMFVGDQWFVKETFEKFKCCRDFYTDVADYLRYKVLKDEVFPERNIPAELQEIVRKEFLGTARIEYDKLMAEYDPMQREKPHCSCWKSENEFDIVWQYRGVPQRGPRISSQRLTCPAVVTHLWNSSERTWFHTHGTYLTEGEEGVMVEDLVAELDCRFDAKTCKGHYTDHDWVLDQEELKVLTVMIEGYEY